MLVSCLSGQHSLPPKWVKTFTHPPIRSRVGLGARHWPGSTGTVSGNQQLGVVVGFPGNRSKGVGSEVPCHPHRQTLESKDQKGTNLTGTKQQAGL